MLFEFVGHTRRFLAYALVLGVLAFGLSAFATGSVSAATGVNQQLNFQGRLLNAQGATAPDGFYNVEFKIYQDGAGTTAGNPGGTLKWTEDWLNNAGHGVQVVNGYISVQLGSLTSLSAVDWNQDTLWLSINIGNTNGTCTPFSSCSGDGEMLPMKRLSSSPYALNAARLGGLSSADFIQNQNSAVQTGANLWMGGTARVDTSILTPLLDTASGVALNIGTTNATSINLNQNVTVAAGKSLTLAGGNTASRPAGAEGKIYYDTTTKQLLTYANGKWQADRSTATKIVAASNSSQAAKDAADYVATGTNDETQINAALTAAAGGKVYLMEGTYTIGASISVPNNTTLAGAGYGTVITIPNSFNTNIDAITNTTTGGSGTGVTIQDLRLEGNKGNQTAGVMHGINFNGVGSGTGSSAVQGGKITNIWANNWYGAGGAGIRLVSSSNNTITGNTTQGSISNGIYIDTNSNYNVISSNVTQGNTYGITLSSGSLNDITGNTIQGNSSYGIYLSNTSNKNTITGNSLYDNGGSTTNNAIDINNSDNNTITGNTIADTSATTNNYAINIAINTSDNNYLADNTFSSTPGTSTINDAGTGTTYANQPRAENGGQLTNRTVNDTQAFTVQNASGTNVLAVDTTNSQVVLGDSATAGKLVISDGSSNTVTLSVNALAGNYTLAIPTITANDTVCLQTLANCGSGVSGVTTVGALDGGTANATGATISGTIIYLQSASATYAGLVNTTTQTFAGAKTFNQSVTLATGKTLNITGDTTANRPGSPSEGTVYYDTTTKQLLTYANGKWQADRSTATKIVAASNSTQTEKDAADYVATGTSDETQINAALTAAAGGKVYLMEGTYTIGASISVPNNTTLAGAGYGTVITIPNSFNANIDAITNTTTGGNGTGITIQDLRLEGNNTNQTTGTMNGIYLNGVGSATVHGGKVTNVWSNNWRSSGIGLWSSSTNNLVIGNSTQGNTTFGIVVSTSSNNVITNNTSKNNSYGIQVGSSSNNTISTNTLYGNSSSGINLSSGNYNSVIGNVTQSNNSYGISLNTSSTSNTVSGNIVNNNGGSNNNGIYLDASDKNTITGNNITDSSAATTNYAINIFNNTSDNNYLADNTFSSTPGTSTINDAGTGTVYANQPRAENGGQLTNRTVNDTQAFTVQNASGTNILDIDTTNSKVLVSGIIDTTTGTTLNIGTATATAISIGSAGITTTIAGNTGVTLSGATGTTMVCRNGSGYLSSCDATFANPTATNFIQNQSGSTQTGNFNISGTGVAATLQATNLVGTTLDTASGVALNIGAATPTTTQINLNQNTVIASGKNFTVTSGTTGITGNTTINTSGSGTTSIGSNAGGAVAIAANAASSFTTNTGALTLTSAAGTTWSTAAGTLTLQGAGGATLTTAAGTTSSAVTISTGNASAGASGNISIDVGTATTTAGTLNLGTVNANSIVIGHGGLTNIQGYIDFGSNVTTNAKLNMYGTITQSSGSSLYGMYNQSTYVTANAASTASAFFQDATLGSASNAAVTNLFGLSTRVGINAGYTGTVTNARGIDVKQLSGIGTNTIGSYRGIHVAGNSINTGNTSGNVENTQLYLDIISAAAGSGGTMSNYGIYLRQPNGNTAGTNDYGLYLTGNGGASATSNYAIYNDSTAANYLQGAVSIGTNSNPNGYALNVNGTAASSTSILTPSLDRASAGTLSIGTNATNTTAITLGNAAATTSIASNTTYHGTSGNTITIQGVTQATTNTAGNTFVVQGATGNGTGAGGQLTVQGGSGGATSGANGGNLKLNGGTATGTGYTGLVVLNTPTFLTATSDANCYTSGALVASSCTITSASTNSNGAVLVGFSTAGQTATLSDPGLGAAAVGRIIYVTAANTSSDFTLSVNGGGQGNLIAMRQNTTATMIWNGSDWTAAGASSSTTLQSAYDNTLQSAGGAELVVSKTSATNGLTIRDSSTNSVNGALLTVQSSSAANLFSVNSNVTEYTTDSGAEVAGASSSTFPASTWTNVNGSGTSTVTRYTTTGNYIATGQGSVSVATTGANDGVKNILTSALTANMHYNVSFTTRLASGTFTDMAVYYSIDGSANSVTCASGQTSATSIWTKVNCTFTAPSSGITSSNAIIIRQVAGATRTFYIDNISVTIAADYNLATDGGIDDAVNFTTNWTSVSSATITRSTSSGNDASDSAQVVTTAANQGVRNKLSMNPLTSTMYRLTAYANITSGTFTTFTVRYSRDGGTNFAACADYNTQTITASSTAYTKVTCYITTDSTAATSPYVYFTQTDGTGRTFNVDTFSMNLSSNTTPNVQVGGGVNGGPTTLFTVDRGASAPIASNNDALLGSMYYDTTLGKLQCYEADGWGACGSSPDNIITISPEYTNAVLHGTGIGTMTSDICSATLGINDGSSSQPTICSSGETYNFYKWTSPQASDQKYSIYVTYQLPSTFKSFNSGQTSVQARVDNLTYAYVKLQIYKNHSGLTACGSENTITTSVNTWQAPAASGTADPSTCGFAAGDSIVFKITTGAQRNANAYVGNLNFAFSNK